MNLKSKVLSFWGKKKVSGIVIHKTEKRYKNCGSKRLSITVILPILDKFLERQKLTIC